VKKIDLLWPQGQSSTMEASDSEGFLPRNDSMLGKAAISENQSAGGSPAGSVPGPYMVDALDDAPQHPGQG
jgi:hypothetical protein